MSKFDADAYVVLRDLEIVGGSTSARFFYALVLGLLTEEQIHYLLSDPLNRHSGLWAVFVQVYQIWQRSAASSVYSRIVAALEEDRCTPDFVLTGIRIHGFDWSPSLTYIQRRDVPKLDGEDLT